MLLKLRTVAFAAVAVGLLAFTAAPAAAFAATASTARPTSPAHATQRAAAQAPVTGTATNALGQTVNFAGTLTPTSASPGSNGTVNILGTLNGTLTNATTGATNAVTQQISAAAAVDPSCPVLNLTLGPLDLNLLGLVVHLNQVVLNITAEGGPGNLLGNLVCAVANLLNGTGTLTSLSGLLSQLLNALLGGLGGL